MQALVKVGELSDYHILDIPIIEYTINTLKENGIDCILITDDDDFKDMTKHQYTYCKLEEISDYLFDAEVIFIPENVILVNKDVILSLINYHHKEKNIFSVLSIYKEGEVIPKVIRNNRGIEIVNIDDSQFTRECYSGIYLTDGDSLKKALESFSIENAYNYYLNKGMGALLTLDSVHLINDLSDISDVNIIVKKKVNEELLKKSVYIIDKDNTYISPDSVIEEGTIIEPGSIIFHSRIGKSNKILGQCRIVNCVIGNENMIESCSLKDSFIGNNNKLGPYAQFRNNTNIGDFNRIGNFVELKSSMIASHTNAAHLAYIGNCDCGNNVNIGCGSITVNYDGKHKYKTIIKDNAFIGCNSNLIAPVVIHEKAFIAAGSTITKDVEESSLAIARARQINKEGYLKERP